MDSISRTMSTTYSNCYQIARMQPMNNTEERRKEYALALMDCRINPAYYAQTPMGELPATCEPLMSWDSRGWTTITKRVRVKKVKTVMDLEEESKLDNWDDVEHYGRATYVNTERPYEHNGALFDIGSRF